MLPSPMKMVRPALPCYLQQTAANERVGHDGNRRAVFSVVQVSSLGRVDETAVEVTFKRIDGREPHSCRLYFVDDRRTSGVRGVRLRKHTPAHGLPFHRSICVRSGRAVGQAHSRRQGAGGEDAGMIRSVVGRDPVRPLTPL